MNNDKWIEISLSAQTLSLLSKKGQIKHYPVSSAKNGAGEIMDSECTPRGKHVIAEKIGASSEVNTVFVGRQASGEIYEPSLRKRHPERDWILTRILWLRGTEPGLNMGGKVDSFDRYIYIHGTPDDVDMNVCGSRGCIRLRNQDVIDLFEQVEEGTSVIITED
ncbi:MAG: L,D-transpeptidase YbiS [Gammaproteobacteria bacterium]|jgi:L,D-transpeptidase YbiS